MAARVRIPRKRAYSARVADCREQVDSIPMELPEAGRRPLTLREEMQRFIRQEISKQAVERDMGSFEEEDDFSEDDPEPDILTPYEAVCMLDEARSEGETLDGEPEAPQAEGLGVDGPTRTSPEDQKGTSTDPSEARLKESGDKPPSEETE